MLFRFLGLNRILPGVAACVGLALSLPACNSYNNSSRGGSTGHASGIAFRAFVSNPVHPSTIGGHGPAIEIIDASRDLLSGFLVNLTSLTGSVADAGALVLSPKRDRTVVISPSDNKLGIVNNSSETISGAVTLPGPTQSVLVWTDNTTAFAAVPSAPVTGASPGAVLRVDIKGATITATVPIPGVQYIVPSPNGNQILAFSNNSNVVSVLTPSLIGTGTPSATTTCSSTAAVVCTITDASLDHPIGAAFTSDGSTAYVVSCGPECGGTSAAISKLDMGGGTTPPSFVTPAALVPGGATVALLEGSTLFVAGTPSAPQNVCGSGVPATTATSCGQLTVVNTTTMTASASVDIADGIHSTMEMGANGQLFVGAIGCTAATCLNIVDTSSGSVSSSNVAWATDGGNVTGIAPVPNRTVVYVCVGGRLRIYSTLTDKLITNPLQPDIIGQAVDVKIVDF
jgi:hypothetical protein